MEQVPWVLEGALVVKERDDAALDYVRSNPESNGYDGWDMQCAFKAGWDEATERVVKIIKARAGGYMGVVGDATFERIRHTLVEVLQSLENEVAS